MRAYWEKSLIRAIPPRVSWQSIPAVASNPFLEVPLKEWVPVAKTADGGNKIIPQMNAIAASPALDTLTQQIIEGKMAPRAILQQLQGSLEQLMR
jgi:hypothetical protein